MCLLSFYPAHADLNLGHLCTGAENNPDGFGFAIVAGDRVEVFRSMDLGDTLAAFVRARHAFPEGDAMFHSRIATAGLVTVENVHPFPVGRDGRQRSIVVGHNGVLPWTAQPDKGDPRSDTRVFAEDMFLPRFKDLDSPKTIRRLETWLTPYNKLVFLTTNPYYKRRSYILNESQGDWVDGVWHSNTSYLTRSYSMWAYAGNGYTFSPASGKRYASRKEELTVTDCAFCWARNQITLGLCQACYTCNFCGLEDEHCECFVTDAGVKAIGSAPVVEINSQPLSVDVTAEATYCDWCSEEDTVCVCVGGAARADVAARAADTGMSETEMDAHWERLMADYDLKVSAKEDGA